MRLIRLFLGMVRVSVQRVLAHRVDLLFQGLMTAVGVASGALALGIVFTHAHRLAGWSLGQSLVLLGAFSVVSGVLGAFVEPNLAFFPSKIWNGELDDLLVQPAPSLFLVSLGTADPWALAQSGLGIVVIAAGIGRLGGNVTVDGLLGFAVLLICGFFTAWAYRVMVAALAFWAPGFEPTVFYSAFWQMGRYPAGIYRPVLRWALLYLVPVGMVTTAPAHALAHGLTIADLLRGIAGAIAAMVLVRAVWRAGLRRYSGATS